MKRGEKAILGGMAVFLTALAVYRVETRQPDRGIPYYTTASKTLQNEGAAIYSRNDCIECHSLWTVRNMLRFVPAPKLDGIGSLRNEDWFYKYFSAPDPQKILPSRLKKRWRMPSYAKLPEHDRRILAQYMASLKVKNWYLEQTRAEEYQKLTGKPYKK